MTRRELFLFVRPPRPTWPFNGPSTGFWPPLAFASLAGALRQALPDLRVRILDGPALRMGWKSLEEAMRSLGPAYVGIGEEAVSSKEGLRLAALSRSMGALVIAGGCFYGHLASQALGTGLVDFVVRGEGEETIVELVAALRSREVDALRRVRGVSFAAGGEVVHNPPRQPMADLDRLPLPAYDLLPVESYGRRSRNHPDLATIELSRGCAGSCSFCVLWRQMGRFRESGPEPLLRAKSPERVREEVRILVGRFGRRYLAWVDPCFNAHPEVPGRAAEMILRDGIRIGQSAWVRADGIVRDAAAGSLSSCVRSGLNEVYIGVERPDAAGLKRLGKSGDPHETREALRILARDHPGVFTVGSFIYGLPGDRAETVRDIYRYSLELDLDMAFYIPLTPLPGTPYWRPELWDPTGERLRRLDFLPVYGNDGRQGELGRTLLTCIALDWRPLRVGWYLRRLFARDTRKRRIHRHLFFRGLRFSMGRALDALMSRGRRSAMRVPRWYES